ncbi:MAG: bifunctional 5,10-methylenetetrahydrofolate dehydrogenase/5,10-methenyltetrahydrofolate cyclohydrolase [Planctomycetes bacterium]|nr:bifunctional 5,10-methylenetetrahydrofolate dehydrogenase/5,10-methenyltetrahydrofolate cyclohydrolase [Planctomycetota bacterium]
MTAEILDGRALADRLLARLHTVREQLGHRPVRLVSLEVGKSAAAEIYMRNQRRAAEHAGIDFEALHLPQDATQDEVVQRIHALNDDPSVSGILVQRPLPDAFDPRAVQMAVRRQKDVEGMNPANMGSILYREPRLPPCTAAAALELIRATGTDLRGAETVVVGHSEIVGKPIAILLLHHLATVTVCHVGTKDLSAHTRRADILVVAVGKAGLVHTGMIKPGAIVIDIGINYVDGKLCGDVDFAAASEVAGFVTPVPGGVGPVTVAMLMRNTLRAAGAEDV